MKKLLLLATTAVLLFASCDLNLPPQERQARATVKRTLSNFTQGDSYDPMAWGDVEFNARNAGTGTKEFIDIKKTGTPPSEYSITHRFRMRNGLGMLMTYEIRVFFTDESCKEWKAMEYMDSNDPTRHIMQK